MKTMPSDSLRSRLNSLIQEREEQVFLVLSLLIGALAGLAVVAFIVLTERLGMRLYPVGSPAWRRVLMPVAGSLAMGYLLYRYFPDARGSGVPQTKAALYARDGNISLRTVLGKFGCTAATLASGIPLGREGPSVQVGAGIASVLGRWLGLRPEKVKALDTRGRSRCHRCGVQHSDGGRAVCAGRGRGGSSRAGSRIGGAGLGHLLGGVALCSWAITRCFMCRQYELVHPLEFGIYAVLGIAGGFLSVAFTKLLLGMRKRFLLLPRRTRWWHPVVGGVMVGLMGWFVPQVLGVGYSYVGVRSNGTMAFKLMVLLVVLKLFAITTSYASGNAGGIFGPALFLGAMLGGAIGTRGPSLVAHLYCSAGSLRAGWHGRALRGNRARSHDIGADDL